MTLTIHFIASDGGSSISATSEPGTRLLEVAQAADMPLEGTCEGQMACSTCHVLIDPDWFGKMPKAHEDEEDMLDLATGATRYSRLACQIMLTKDLDGLTVRLPGSHRNMQGR